MDSWELPQWHASTWQCQITMVMWHWPEQPWLKFNSLDPGKFEWNFSYVIFKHILVIDDRGISCEIALTWKPQDLTDDKSTLVQVMAWCHQATSHYLSHWWPWSLLPYGVTRPQWVNSLTFERCNYKLELVIFKLISCPDMYVEHFLCNCSRGNATRLH